MSKKGEKQEEDSILNEDLDEFNDLDDDRVLPETDNKRWELDEEPIIQNLRFELQKRMNDEGVDAVLSWMRISLGKNIALSNLDINEINSFMRNEMPAFNMELVQNSDEWEIANSSARRAISRWIERSMYVQLKRAYNDGERKYRKDSYQYRENYHHDEVSAGEIGSGFSLPFFGKKKQQPRRREPEYEDF